MTTAATLPGITNHFIVTLGGDLPFHPLARFVGGSGHLLERFVQGQIMAN